MCHTFVTRGRVFLFSLSIVLLSAAPVSGHITTTRVSVATDGTQANNESDFPSVSGDGRYVVYHSFATNLVAGDTNNAADVFLRDTYLETTRRVSLAWNGAQAQNGAEYPAISDDGLFVAFYSLSSNLVPNDTNGWYDVFVRGLADSTTKRFSVSTDGAQGNNISLYPSINANGEFVTYQSFASNLVSGDTNGRYDVFLTNDRQMTQRLSTATDGTQGNNDSTYSDVNANGVFVAFQSVASNLVAGDTNNASDIFLRDAKKERTTCVSVTSAGVPGNALSASPAISAAGDLVAFHSYASDLVPNDTNNTSDVFIRSIEYGVTLRVSTAIDGTEANGPSYDPSISADGRYIAFSSAASNLVPDDTNGKTDIFVRDLKANTLIRVSAHSKGAEANDHCYFPDISADGRFVVYKSAATNLVEDDTNGKVDIFISGPVWEPPPFETEDIIWSLRIAAGITLPAPETVERLDVEKTTRGVTIEDSLRISRKVVGLETNP